MVITQFSNGVKVINCSNRDIRFEDGEVIEIAHPCGANLETKLIKRYEEVFDHDYYDTNYSIIDDKQCENRRYQVLKEILRGDNEAYEYIRNIKRDYPDCILIGNRKLARIFAGDILLPVVSNRYSYMSKKDWIMCIDKFTIY